MIDFSDQNYLLKELHNGNEKAFEFLFRNYYPRLYGYAIRFVDDREAGRDIIQDCFTNLWEKRSLLKSLSIQSLLFAMVRNACINYLKHCDIVKLHRLEYIAKAEGEERLYHTDFVFESEQKFLYMELQEQINQVIEKLPVRCREVFLLSRFKGLKHKDIADKLQISTKTVEKHISKAISIFSSHFKNNYPIDIYIIVIAWLIVI